MTDPVLVHVENRVATLTVNDPERRNAVTAQISAALRSAVTSSAMITSCSRTSGSRLSRKSTLATSM